MRLPLIVTKKLFFSLLLLASTLIGKQLPIVLIHGIIAEAHDMSSTVKYIKKYLPDAQVKNINLGGIGASWKNMFDQGVWFAKKIQKDPDLKDGFILIGHSQGGLVARYYLEHYNNPPVHTYVSWGTPQFGLFGLPGDFDARFAWLDALESKVHTILYSYVIQRTISFAGFWRDTLHFDEYLSDCRFLPLLNNEKDHPFKGFYKDNICSLHNMVLVQSRIEDIIEPAESCHFGFYKIGSKEDIESLFDSTWYKHDELGLKTLYKKGKLHLLFANCAHTDFPEDEENFVENTLPFITT